MTHASDQLSGGGEGDRQPFVNFRDTAEFLGVLRDLLIRQRNSLNTDEVAAEAQRHILADRAERVLTFHPDAETEISATLSLVWEMPLRSGAADIGHELLDLTENRFNRA